MPATTTNVFTSAKPRTAASKKPKFTTPLEGIETYSAIDASIKWMKTLLETVKVTVKESAYVKLIAAGIRAGKAPESFDANDGKGSGNIQLRVRSPISGLNDIEQELAASFNVPLKKTRTFLFNPEHNDWLLANSEKVSAVLAKLNAPDDLVQVKDERVIATQESLDYVFRTFPKHPEVIAQLLPVVSTFAIRPKYAGDQEEALEVALEFSK